MEQKTTTTKKRSAPYLHLALLPLTMLILSSCIAAESGGGTHSTETESNVDEGAGDAPVVTIEDSEFSAGNITVEAGTTVTWNWEDKPVAHNIVSDNGHFESPLQSDGSWSYTFEEPGVYPYHCGPHPHMTGEVTVVETSSG